MGGYLGKAMESQAEKQQKFMVEMNKITLERQIQMQNQMRERQVAMQIAGSREMFAWLGTFYAFASVAMIAG